jgi:uncharacterized caspase-like protein
VKAVLAFRDGRPIERRTSVDAQGEVSFELPLLQGEDRLTFTAEDSKGFVSRPVSVVARAPGGSRPDLWIVSVGVGKYPHLSPEEQLRGAAPDARSIVDSFKDQAGKGKPFAAVHTALLTDDEATAPAILGAVAGLAAMRPDDLAIVFFAGHGVKVREDADMRFLTRDVSPTPASVMKDGVGWGDISSRLAGAHGRVLLLLDACHSGHMSQDLVVPNGALASQLWAQGRAGVLVFAAAKGRQASLEDGQHGFFTRAVMETLKDPAADRDHDGRIELSELLDAVTVRVDHFTHGKQTPWITRRELFGDYVVAAPPPSPR